jgi:hypothetical protein
MGETKRLRLASTQPVTRLRHRPTPALAADEPQVESSRIRAAGDGLVVVLVDDDALARAPLARALARSGAQLSPVDTLSAAIDSCAELEVAHVLVCSVDGPGVAEALFAIGDRHPGVAVLARTSSPAIASTMLGMVGLERFEIVSGRPGVPEMVAKVLALGTTARDASEHRNPTRRP